MRILKVWDSEYPWDVRAEKVCLALTDLGHEVHMVARNRDRRILHERLDECVIHRMSPLPVLGPLVDRASQFPAFFNPRWTSLIRRNAIACAADVILVRDLPLALAAIRIGRELRTPVVLDMAENYPAMIRDLWTTKSTKPGDVLIRNPRIVQAIERKVLREIDHVVVVVEESRDRLLSLGLDSGRISVVGNTPSVNRSTKYATERRYATEPNSMHLVYLGLMEEARGVGLAIQAVASARERGAAITLDLIGDGRALPSFQKQVRDLGLSEVIRFKGFVPYETALGEVAQADAGLIPHFGNESWETTIPNKLFDYMSLGVPVIASDVTPVSRVLKETGAGLVFADRDADDFARVLQSALNDEDLMRMGKAGMEAVRSTYNWERDVERLEEALKCVSGVVPA